MSGLEKLGLNAKLESVTPVRERTSLELGSGPEVFSVERVGWLIRLRWFALLGIAVAAAFSALGAFPGVRWQVLVSAAALAAVYNFLLWRSYRVGASPAGDMAGTIQALGDMLLLTVVLWAAGGAECPFVSYYVFHVAIVGILAGPKATQTAAITAMVGTGFLVLSSEFSPLRIGYWNPVPPWDFIAEAVAFVSTVGTVAYLVTHAVRELRDREKALVRARDGAALEYELLSNTLDQLEAGLEVLASDGRVAWRNRRAEELASDTTLPGTCPRTGHACTPVGKEGCPIELGLAHAEEPGRCRFALKSRGNERVYEMLTFPLASTHTGVQLMNLYVDRTQATLADQRLLLAERLVSLGRVAQGVAHELNTPLATIRTLATDMRASVRDVQSEEGGFKTESLRKLCADVEESAALVHDETLRLGRITQSLLAGGDLVRSEIQGEVPVAALVERARALVFAGVRNGPRVELGEGIDDLRVKADPDRLVQVLVNLLQNAYDAVRTRDVSGKVLIRAEFEAERARILIEDNGEGVPADVRQRLFEPFATSKTHGTGLGLYTSYMLARAMEGDLWLDPRAGGGTIATLCLIRAPYASTLRKEASV